VPELLDDTKARYKFLRWRVPNSNFFGREIQKMSNWYLVMIQPKFYAIPIIYDLTNWLRDNCKDEYECYGMYYKFKNKEDAAKFILFWG
jgi:hypothetical protein